MMEPGKQAEFQTTDCGINDTVILERVGHITGGPSSYAKSGEEFVMPNVIVKKKSKKEKKVTIAPDPIIVPPTPAAVAVTSMGLDHRKTTIGGFSSLSALAAMSPHNDAKQRNQAMVPELDFHHHKKSYSHLKHLGDSHSVGFSSHHFHRSPTHATVAGSGTQAVKHIGGTTAASGHGHGHGHGHGGAIHTQVDLDHHHHHWPPPLAVPLYRSGSPPREDGSTSPLIFG